MIELGHWADAYYGDLYQDSVADLLTPRLSTLEAEVIGSLLGAGPGARVLDVACGHGRHARILAERGLRAVGLDRSGPYLTRAAAAGDRAGDATAQEDGPRWIRADVRALPLRDGAFDGAFSWYASLFMFDDRTNLACLSALARVVRPGGRVLVHHANPLRLAARPRDAARRELPDGGVVDEISEYDAATGVDRCRRRLVRPSGAVLAGTAELRYYKPSEWGPLSALAGLRILELTSTTGAAGHPRRGLDPESPDLIALLEKPT
jgi:SAM-dependent methyltransferase